MHEKEEGLEFLFKRISVKLNRSPEEFEPFLKILKQNWYDTEDSLRQATDDDYEKMKIPVRIVSLIKQELKIPPKIIPEEPKMKEKKPSSKLILDEEIMNSLCQSLANNLLNKFNGNRQQAKSILQIVLKLIRNIVKDPYEMKFRNLKKSNKLIFNNIYENQPCLNFMKAIGFQEVDDILELHAHQIHQFIFIEECLENLLQYNQNGNCNHKVKDDQPRFIQFDKLPENTLNNNSQKIPSNPFSEEQLGQMRYADALEKLIQYRQKIMSKPPANRRLRIYHQRLENRNIKFAQINFETEFSTSDDEGIAAYWKNYILQNRKNSNFQSKRKLEFQHLIKQQVYKQALIRIKLPNELIIQAVFGPLQKLSDVFSFVTQIAIGDLYMFTAPPKKIMKKKQFDMTLYDLDAVPMGYYYLGSDYQFYIGNEYSKIIQK